MNKKFFLIACISALLCSCELDKTATSQIDSILFQLFEKTLFNEPTAITSKEIHLEDGQHLGSVVKVNGKIINIGDFETHLVIKDDYGQLLVVTTEYPSAFIPGKKVQSGDEVSILGTVERGKKGLPYIHAKAIVSAALPTQLQTKL